MDTTGKQAVWSKWGAKKMPVGWSFSAPVRIKAMHVTILHPNPANNSSHAVRLYATAFSAHPSIRHRFAR